MNPAGEEIVTEASSVGLPPCTGGADGRRAAHVLASEDGRRAARALAEEGGQGATRAPLGEDGQRAACARTEMQRALGVESVYGYHVETPLVPGGRFLRVLDVVPQAGPAVEGGPFPCLDGVRYGGCLGLGCPLETCWTGGATVSYAQRRRAETRVSTALYLPGAPCHECAHVREDVVSVPAPRAMIERRHGAAQPMGDAPPPRRRRTDTRAPAQPTTEAARNGGAQPTTEVGHHDGHVHTAEARNDGHVHSVGEAAPLQLRRVSCGRGLWAHPISLSSFLTKRIPMLDQDEPAACTDFAERAEPHPEVAAYLRLRRERARERRLEQRAVDAAP